MKSMKKVIYALMVCVFILSTISAGAQIGDIKKGAAKLKEKAAGNEKATETEKKTTSGATTTVDFKELETQKMEWTSTFERLEKGWDKINYEQYNAKKAEYNKFYADFSAAYKKDQGKDHNDDYTKKLIAKVDGYYTETVPAEKMTALKEKVKRSFDEKDWTVYPSDRVKDIENAQDQIEGMKIFLIKNDPALTEYEKTLQEQKEKINLYVANGGLEKRDAEIEKKLVEERRLHAAAMTDASVNAVVVSKIDKEKYGTVLRVVITSGTWEIENNELGKPKLKFVRVDIATKKADGKCYYVKGSVAQKHMGGGVYGDKYLNIYYTEGEMNCNNVNE